jgi:hypothetical protein
LSRVSLSAEPLVSRASRSHIYAGIAFTTLATLVLELSLTRIFSVVFYYHFAFLAISIAMFGLGAGGVFSYVVAERSKNLYRGLGMLALADALAVVAALWFVLSRPAELGYGTLALVYLASALPFFLSGAVISIAMSESIKHIHWAYFCDLAGAAAGCLLLVPFLNYFGGPDTVIAAGVFFAIAAAFWFHHAGAMGSRAGAVLLGLLLVILMLANHKQHWIDIRTAKGQNVPPERFTAWNSFSRIGVQRVDSPWNPDAHWTIIIDGDAGTGIAQFDWDRGLSRQQRSALLHQGPGFPYALKPGAKALIIGPGGGYDVARALASGSRDISGVEINPIIANKVMRGVMEPENHRIYSRPGVRIFVEDGRSFVRRSPEKYQVLQATLVDTWASTAAGAFALSENNLYTTDAFYDYLSHLTDDGVLAFTRWGFDPPRESLRLVTLAMDALARLGENDPAKHVIAVREDSTKIQGWGAMDTVLISRKPFGQADLDRARTLIVESKFETVYLPGDPARNAFGALLASRDPHAFLREYPYDVSAVGDDRPFFFYTVQPRDLWNFIASANRGSADYKINRAVPLLFGLMGISIWATLLMLALPRLLLGHRLPKKKGVISFLWYFVFLGIAYILIQVALIQKFVLLLGTPTYALTVIVFSMLLASGAGSYFSRSLVGEQDSRLMRTLVVAAVLVMILAFSAAPLVRAAAAWPLVAKLLLTTVAIAPAAFFMGMPFPSGLRRLERVHPPSVRWAWALNAAASVLGSAAAIFLAIYLGLRATLLAGGLCYLCALGVIAITQRSSSSYEA